VDVDHVAEFAGEGVEELGAGCFEPDVAEDFAEDQAACVKVCKVILQCGLGWGRGLMAEVEEVGACCLEGFIVCEVEVELPFNGVELVRDGSLPPVRGWKACFKGFCCVDSAGNKDQQAGSR